MALTLVHLPTMNMIQTIIEAFSFGFFTRAISAGALLGITYGLLGNFVVLRREVPIGHSVANIIFFGIALGVLFNLSLPLMSLIFASLGVAVIFWLQNYTSVSRDSAIEMISQIAIAAAIVTLSQIQGYQNIENFLFGSILAVSKVDLILAGILTVLNLLVFSFLWRPLTQTVINTDLARSGGARVNFANFLFMLMLSFSVALGIKIIGVILISAFLVIPPNISKLIASTYRRMLILSIFISFLATLLGLILSYLWDTPSGAMIILVLGAGLIFATLFGRNR